MRKAAQRLKVALPGLSHNHGALAQPPRELLELRALLMHLRQIRLARVRVDDLE